MKHLISCVTSLIGKCEIYRQRIVAKHRVDEGINPVRVFNIVHNRLVQTYEIMNFYSNEFPSTHGKRFEDHLSEHYEETARVMNLQASLFVFVISAMEASAKLAVRDLEGYISPKKKGQLYLREIFERAKALRWVSAEEAVAWGEIIDIRNKLVHSDGEFGRSYNVVIPNGVKWVFIKGRKADITLRHYFDTIEWMIGSYSIWCESCLIARCNGLNYSPVADRFLGSPSNSNSLLTSPYKMHDSGSYGYFYHSKRDLIWHY